MAGLIAIIVLLWLFFVAGACLLFAGAKNLRDKHKKQNDDYLE